MTGAQLEAVAAWICEHWGTRESAPLDPRRGHGRKPPPAAHPQRTRDHGHLKEPGHPAPFASSTAPEPPSP